MNATVILEEYLKQNSTYRKEETDVICSFFEEVSLKKEDPLFASGERFPKIVFIASGILRIFILDDTGEEIVKNFAGPKEFLADIDSFEDNLPACINVSAVTDCSLLALTKSASDRLSLFCRQIKTGNHENNPLLFFGHRELTGPRTQAGLRTG